MQVNFILFNNDFILIINDEILLIIFNRRLVPFHLVFEQLDSQIGHKPFSKGMFDSKEFINHSKIYDVYDIFNEIVSIQQARFAPLTPLQETECYFLMIYLIL